MTPTVSALLARFPPRPVPPTWTATASPRQDVNDRLLELPFTAENPSNQTGRQSGLIKLLNWLEDQPGHTWQQRWQASGGDAAGNLAWRGLAARWLRHKGWASKDPQYDFVMLGRGMLALICGDVIRPTLGWLLTPASPKHLTAEMARARDPQAFAALAALSRTDPANAATKDLALRRIATIIAGKGGVVADITVGDCLQLLHAAAAAKGGRTDTSPYFYQLLHTLGIFPPTAPATVRMFKSQGQLSVEQLVDRYPIACRPVRDLLVDYLRERQPVLDHATLRSVARTLASMFWRDLETHHRGIDSLKLAPPVAAAWKQRVTVKTVAVTTAGGQRIESEVPRHDGMNTLAIVRAFYLDIAQWAVDEPSRWGRWAVTCPIREEEMSRKKERAHRKSRMDQRTRERLPIMPLLITTVDTARKETAERLAAARAVAPGQEFTAAGQTLRRPVMGTGASARVWADDPVTGDRRDLTLQEHRAFWAWASVEVLRLTGIRIEELTELSHHSLIHYTLPATGELVPLMQIAPSKTDVERLLVIAPELADVLSTIICRIRDQNAAVPLVIAYDIHERVWNPPMPLLFQRRIGIEHRPINAHGIRALLNAALAGTGLTDAAGKPLNFTPHDFRRLWITDAIMHGMPPHIAQLVAGHGDLNTTMGYNAVYPEEVINGHRAFIARRRATRPSAEYRTPTDTEWEEFLGHFERRRVSLGTCGRSYASSCIHEHSCIRCPLLRPDPAQRPRLVEIRANLTARITEAIQQGWAGEVEGLKISLAATEQKLAQADQIAARRGAAVDLGMPGLSEVAGRTSTATATAGKQPS
jgi:integrase